jgi:hypothetical protein
MPERTIRLLYYTNSATGESYAQGEKVDLSDEEAERGDALYAFEESPDPADDPDRDAVQAFSKGAGVNTGDPGQHNYSAEGGGSDQLPADVPRDIQPTVPAELTDDEIDQLSSAQLDDALEEVGIDPSVGGSKAGGGMTVDEKRAALKERVG